MLVSWQDLGIIDMMIQFEISFDAKLDADRLARAFDLSLDAEPVAGCRFVRDGRCFWERVAEGRSGAFVVSTDAAACDRFLVEPLNLSSGPQVRALLAQRSGGDRLVLKVSHALADAGGTKHYARTLSSIYRALDTDPRHAPEPNVAGSRSVGQIFRALPWRAHPRVLVNLWREIRGLNLPPVTHAIALPACERGPLGFAVRHLPVDRVSALSAYGRAHSATLNDLLMSAFVRAQIDLGRWDGESQVRLQTTVDLRRYLPGRRAGGVCNLSAFDYAFLGTEPGADFDATLGRVTAITSRRKADWTGLTLISTVPVLWSMGYPRIKRFFAWLFKRSAETRNQPNALTNMGPIAPEDLDFGVRPVSAWLLTPPIHPPMFGMGLTGYSGTLTLSVGVPVAALPEVETFMDAMLKELP
ncbi:MAG: hypothetical protein HY897_15940 [Deltaproteobacteria bacterium]|nr:hypothetical protein [Deltaproteobacteria bacterium]